MALYYQGRRHLRHSKHVINTGLSRLSLLFKKRLSSKQYLQKSLELAQKQRRTDSFHSMVYRRIFVDSHADVTCRGRLSSLTFTGFRRQPCGRDVQGSAVVANFHGLPDCEMSLVAGRESQVAAISKYNFFPTSHKAF